MTKEEFMRIGAITPKSRGRRAEDEHCDVKVFLPLTRSGKEPDKVNVMTRGQTPCHLCLSGLHNA